MPFDYQLPPEPPAHVRFERMPQEQRPQNQGISRNQTPQPPARPNTTSQSRVQQAISEDKAKTAKKHKPAFGPANIGSTTKSQIEAVFAHSTNPRDRQRTPQSQKQSSEESPRKQKMRPPTWKDLLRAKQYREAILAKKAQRTRRVDTETLVAQIRETIEMVQEIASSHAQTQRDLTEMQKRREAREQTRFETQAWEQFIHDEEEKMVTGGNKDIELEAAEQSSRVMRDNLYRDLVAERTAQAAKDEAEKMTHRKRQADPDGGKIITNLIKNELKPIKFIEKPPRKSPLTIEA